MIWTILAVILVLIGIAGTLLPALPGLPVVYAGLLLAAWADGFVHVSGWTMIVLAIITVLAMAADLLAGIFGPKFAGASAVDSTLPQRFLAKSYICVRFFILDRQKPIGDQAGNHLVPSVCVPTVLSLLGNDDV